MRVYRQALSKASAGVRRMVNTTWGAHSRSRPITALNAALTATPTVAISSHASPCRPAPMCWVSRMVVAELMVSSTMTTTFITWLPLPTADTAAEPKWESMNWRV